MTERLEDRRMLTVTYTLERHDVEGNRIGVYAEFTADVLPTSAVVDYGDGTVVPLWVDYDANTHTGSVGGLYDYPAAGSYDVAMTLIDPSSSDARTFQVAVVDEPAAPQLGVVYDSPSPFGPFDSATANVSALGTAPAVTGVYMSGSA